MARLTTVEDFRAALDALAGGADRHPLPATRFEHLWQTVQTDLRTAVAARTVSVVDEAEVRTTMSSVLAARFGQSGSA